MERLGGAIRPAAAVLVATVAFGGAAWAQAADGESLRFQAPNGYQVLAFSVGAQSMIPEGEMASRYIEMLTIHAYLGKASSTPADV